MGKFTKSNTIKPLLKRASGTAKKLTITKAKLREISQRSIKKVSLDITGKRGKIYGEKLLNCIKKQEYECSICLQLMVYPIMLECGHSFCLDCIENVALAKQSKQLVKCPLCRNIEDLKFCEKNSMIQQRIMFIAQTILSKQQKQQFNIKLEAFYQKMLSRGISHDLAIGDKVKLKIYNAWQLAKVNNVITLGKMRLYELKKLKNDSIYYCYSDSYNIMPLDLHIEERYENIWDGMDISMNNLFSQSLESFFRANIYDNIHLFDLSDYEDLDQLPQPPRLQRINNIIIERSPRVLQNIIELD